MILNMATLSAQSVRNDTAMPDFGSCEYGMEHRARSPRSVITSGCDEAAPFPFFAAHRNTHCNASFWHAIGAGTASGHTVAGTWLARFRAVLTQAQRDGSRIPCAVEGKRTARKALAGCGFLSPLSFIRSGRHFEL